MGLFFYLEMNDPLYTRCYEKALFLLARAEHSRRGLELKLCRKEFPPQTVRLVLDRLTDEGALDDGRFARLWINSRVRRKNEGGGVLVQGLIKRGISRELAEETVKALRGEELYLGALRAAYERLRKKEDLSRAEIFLYLGRKGFSRPEIRSFLEEFPEESTD
jgi:regulatory protein